MRPSRPLATALLIASLTVAGCQLAPRTHDRRRAGPTGHHHRSRNHHCYAPDRIHDDSGPHAGRGLRSAAMAGLGHGAPATPIVQQRPGLPGPRRPPRVLGAGGVPPQWSGPGRLLGPLVDLVGEDGSGRPVPVAGAAALQVVINAPALGQDSHGYVGKVLAEPRADFYTPAQLAGWSSLREVRYAGSFEGQTTIAVGVRARVPFRVFTVLDRGGHYRSVVLDVAP